MVLLSNCKELARLELLLGACCHWLEMMNPMLCSTEALPLSMPKLLLLLLGAMPVAMNCRMAVSVHARTNCFKNDCSGEKVALI